jgi:Na+/H+-dicarboxylate symporter
MLTKNEKKTLAIFAIFLGTFYTMMESQEAKEEFLRELEGIKHKVFDDMTKKGNMQ